MGFRIVALRTAAGVEAEVGSGLLVCHSNRVTR